MKPNLLHLKIENLCLTQPKPHDDDDDDDFASGFHSLVDHDLSIDDDDPI